MDNQGTMPIKGFISYAHEDKELFDLFTKGLNQHASVFKSIEWTTWNGWNRSVRRITSRKMIITVNISYR